MNGLMLNGSGYMDPTAFMAIMNMSTEGTVMTEQKYMDGDIVLVESYAGDIEILLIKCNERYASGIKLYDREPKENAIEIRSKDIMFADAGKLCYVLYDRIVTLVRTVSHDELDRIRMKIAKALMLPACTGDCVQPVHELEATGIDYDVLADKVAEKIAGRFLDAAAIVRKGVQ